MTAPVLVDYDSRLYIIVEKDSSNYIIVTILLKNEEPGQLVTYDSRLLPLINLYYIINNLQKFVIVLGFK
jgi:hypothetical protein